MPLPLPNERQGHVLGGRYRIEKLLGQGGMGVLYEGRHLLTERRVAIKFLRTPAHDRSVDVDRFLREARVAARLEHPNVVEILDMGLDAESPYLVMELLRGESLADELARTRTLSPARAFQLLAPIMGALATVHDAGVLHRDLKPENIFLARQAIQLTVPKLLDFGVATAVGEGNLTESGVTVGTPSYMSPEQAKGELGLGPASDVWSMGVLWFRALSGRLPHEGTGSTAVLIRIVTEPAPRLKSVSPELPMALTLAIDRALERSVEHRYQDMRSFACALVRAARQDGVSLPPAHDVPGLPDWDRWLKSDEEATHSMPSVPVVVDRDREPQGDRLRPLASEALNTGRETTRWPPRLALAGLGLAALIMITWFAWERPSRSSPTRSVEILTPLKRSPVDLPIGSSVTDEAEIPGTMKVPAVDPTNDIQKEPESTNSSAPPSALKRDDAATKAKSRPVRPRDRQVPAAQPIKPKPVEPKQEGRRYEPALL